MVDDSEKIIYAYEVDGYGGRNLMDNTNIPSQLSAPFTGYLNSSPTNYHMYLNTRESVLDLSNPWCSQGPLISGVGSPHTTGGRAWPIALRARIQTTGNDTAVVDQLKQMVNTTDGL